jgi:hypothetical protein
MMGLCYVSLVLVNGWWKVDLVDSFGSVLCSLLLLSFPLDTSVSRWYWGIQRIPDRSFLHHYCKFAMNSRMVTGISLIRTWHLGRASTDARYII